LKMNFQIKPNLENKILQILKVRPKLRITRKNLFKHG
jgi:hypothetical protein